MAMRPKAPARMARTTRGSTMAAAYPSRCRRNFLSSTLREMSAAKTSSKSTWPSSAAAGCRDQTAIATASATMIAVMSRAMTPLLSGTDLNDRLGYLVQVGRAFFGMPRFLGLGAAPEMAGRPCGPRCCGSSGAGQSNAVVAADTLGLEKTELGPELAVEGALANPALGLDEAQVDIEAEQAFELLADAIRQLAAQQGAALLDHAADLAHELGSGIAHFLDDRNSGLERGAVILCTLRPHTGFGQRRWAERKLGSGWAGQRRKQQRHVQDRSAHTKPPDAAKPLARDAASQRQRPRPEQQSSHVCRHLGGNIAAQ